MATTPKPTRTAATSPIRELETASPGDDSDEPLDDDFHFVLGELLNAYKPILSADLQRAESPDALIKEALANPPSCEDEFAQAMALFERLSSEEIAQRLLPAAVREELGAVERWRWCLLPLRCCIVFGWLMCRGPRSFRGSSYYLWRYWRCMREVLGAPVANPPTAAEKADFNHLVKALAEAYKPYLDDQMASVEFVDGLPEQVLAGRVGCFEDGDANTQILERLLSTDTAAARGPAKPTAVGPTAVGLAGPGPRAHRQAPRRPLLLVLPLLGAARHPLRLLPGARPQPARRVPLPAQLPRLPVPLPPAAAVPADRPDGLRARRDGPPARPHPGARARRRRGQQFRPLRHRGAQPGRQPAQRRGGLPEQPGTARHRRHPGQLLRRGRHAGLDRHAQVRGGRRRGAAHVHHLQRHAAGVLQHRR